MSPTIDPVFQQWGREAFQNGLLALVAAQKGEHAASEAAMYHFMIALEFATQDDWPDLWLEARAGLNEAQWLRDNGC